MATEPTVGQVAWIEQMAAALDRLVINATDYAQVVVNGDPSFSELRALLAALDAAREFHGAADELRQARLRKTSDG